MVNVVLVAVLEDGGLGELAIVGALILMSGLTRLVTLLQDVGSSCKVCLMIFFILQFFVDCWFPPSVVWQGFEVKDSLWVAQFVLGYPPLVEVQELMVLLLFQGHAEGVLPFLCRRLVSLSRT